jgi:hypothetical protein
MKKTIFAILALLLAGQGVMTQAAFLGTIDPTSLVETATVTETVSLNETATITEEKIGEIKDDVLGAGANIIEVSVEGLEKIVSPNLINQYRNLIKKGNALYGAKIANTSDNASQALEKSSSSLEKIVSPDMISLFDNIKKIGTSLWGTRKASSTVAANASSSLEKIASPDQISLFDKIRQIGNALWGIRKENASNARASVISQADAACVNAAIDKKDDSLITSISDYQIKFTVAIEERRACQKEVIGNADSNNQKNGLKACVDTFTKNNREINRISKESRNAIWKTYREELKACNDEEEIIVEDGGADLNL